MKTKEELNTIREEVESLNKKLAELSDDELKQVYGGTWSPSNPGGDDDICPVCKKGHMYPSEDIYATDDYSYEIWTCDLCGNKHLVKC